MIYNLQTSYYKEDYEDKNSRKVFLSLACALAVLFTFFISIGLALQTKYRFIYVSGISMQNTLNANPVGKAQDGVYILLTKDVDYGDIVVHDKSEVTSVIKRVIAKEKDKICIARVKTSEMQEPQIRVMRVKKGSQVVEILDESKYIKSYEIWDEHEVGLNSNDNGIVYDSAFYGNYIQHKTTTTYQVDGVEYKFTEVPEGRIFLMGDNRTESADSRAEQAPALLDKIEGKVVKVARNVATVYNSPFYMLNYVGSYFSLIWDEIVAFFAF